MKKQVLLAGLLLAFGIGAVQAADVAAGKAKANACAACHGVDGNSPAPMFPKLAGQHASYLEKQLKDFKTQTRIDPTMNAMVAALSDEDTADISAYFASQEGTIEVADIEKITLGEKLYRGGNPESGLAACLSCHGPTGTGNEPAGFPSLSGQHVTYLEKALNDFKSETRTNDVSEMMRNTAGRMTLKEIKAVSSYISGLH
jgi:cytochrome c553